MTGRNRTRALACAAIVVALTAAGSAPPRTGPLDGPALYAQCGETAQRLADQYRAVGNTLAAFTCERPDGTPVDPKLWLPAAPVVPAPVPVSTAGHPGCVIGAGRPVTGTVLTNAKASGAALVYEYEPLTGGDTTGVYGGTVLEFGPGDLVPGRSYRWRARFDDRAEQPGTTLYATPESEQGWSPWCEFSVAPGAVAASPEDARRAQAGSR